eukprot:790515-Rhodomonas_salina.6
MADLGRVDAIGMLKHRLGMLGRSVTGEQLRAVESGIEQHRRKDRTGSAMWLALAAQVGLRSSCAQASVSYCESTLTDSAVLLGGSVELSAAVSDLLIQADMRCEYRAYWYRLTCDHSTQAASEWTSYTPLPSLQPTTRGTAALLPAYAPPTLPTYALLALSAYTLPTRCPVLTYTPSGTGLRAARYWPTRRPVLTYACRGTSTAGRSTERAADQAWQRSAEEDPRVYHPMPPGPKAYALTTACPVLMWGMALRACKCVSGRVRSGAFTPPIAR